MFWKALDVFNFGNNSRCKLQNRYKLSKELYYATDIILSKFFSKVTIFKFPFVLQKILSNKKKSCFNLNKMIPKNYIPSTLKLNERHL